MVNSRGVVIALIRGFGGANREIDAELREIAENLHRAELTQLERSEQIARWVELVEAKQVSGQVDQKPQGGRPEGGLSAAARELGVQRKDAERSVKVASISEAAKEAARREGLDNNRSALLQVARNAVYVCVLVLGPYCTFLAC